jgi:SET domain-containing protein
MSARTIRVGRAATGLGLFAVKPFAAKACIVTYRGKRIPTAEAHRRERETSAKYMFEINRRWTIDGSSRRNLARYINHACRPNCEAVLRKGQMVFVALLDIAPDDEITLDYGKDYFDLFIAPLGCRCTACANKATKFYGKPARRKRA